VNKPRNLPPCLDYNSELLTSSPPLDGDLRSYVVVSQLNPIREMNTPQKMKTSLKRHSREARKEQSKEIILQAAIELLLRDGYQKLTVDNLIAYVGGSKKTIYKYFTSRSGLVSAIIEYQLDRATESLAALRMNDRRLKEGLVYVGETVLNVVLSRDFTYFKHLVVHESMEDPVLGRQFFESITNHSFKLLADYLDIHIKRKELKPINSMVLAVYFWSMLMHKFSMELDYRVVEGFTEQEISAHVHETVSNFLKGFGN